MINRNDTQPRGQISQGTLQCLSPYPKHPAQESPARDAAPIAPTTALATEARDRPSNTTNGYRARTNSSANTRELKAANRLGTLNSPSTADEETDVASTPAESPSARISAGTATGPRRNAATTRPAHRIRSGTRNTLELCQPSPTNRNANVPRLTRIAPTLAMVSVCG